MAQPSRAWPPEAGGVAVKSASREEAMGQVGRGTVCQEEGGTCLKAWALERGWRDERSSAWLVVDPVRFCGCKCGDRQAGSGGRPGRPGSCRPSGRRGEGPACRAGAGILLRGPLLSKSPEGRWGTGRGGGGRKSLLRAVCRVHTRCSSLRHPSKLVQKRPLFLLRSCGRTERAERLACDAGAARAAYPGPGTSLCHSARCRGGQECGWSQAAHSALLL